MPSDATIITFDPHVIIAIALLLLALAIVAGVALDNIPAKGRRDG